MPFARTDSSNRSAVRGVRYSYPVVVKSARVERFRCFTDSGEVPLDAVTVHGPKFRRRSPLAVPCVDGLGSAIPRRFRTVARERCRRLATTTYASAGSAPLIGAIHLVPDLFMHPAADSTPAKSNSRS